MAARNVHTFTIFSSCEQKQKEFSVTRAVWSPLSRIFPPRTLLPVSASVFFSAPIAAVRNSGKRPFAEERFSPFPLFSHDGRG
jgi:hypothetical protein